MGFFKPKEVKVADNSAVKDATNEKEETAAQKQRLLGTSGDNKGAQLQLAQGQSIRRVFGN